MIFPDQAVRIVIATKPVDFRKGHDGLAAMAHPTCAQRRARGQRQGNIRQSLCGQLHADARCKTGIVADTPVPEVAGAEFAAPVAAAQTASAPAATASIEASLNQFCMPIDILRDGGPQIAMICWPLRADGTLR